MDSFRAWPPHAYIFEFGMLQSKGLFLWFEKNLKVVASYSYFKCWNIAQYSKKELEHAGILKIIFVSFLWCDI